MKRLEEITREWSIKFFFSKEIPVELTDEFQKEIELYAREVAQASLHKAAENAKIEKEYSIRYQDFIPDSVDKESITNPNNITLL
ncbi:hypothetical protein [Elizabethkingia meningoseptica]|uniref:hypothetical protein n=1 Tax=Elizabethkingia meningoseptica TaxID=238 RepID=UPI003158B35A